MPTTEQFLNSIERDAHLLAEAARKGLDAPVPTCPGWTVQDVVVHTGVIYLRKEQVVVRGVGDRETAVDQPTDQFVTWFEDAFTRMLDAFKTKVASDPVWTWHPTDQTAGFWFRRMAHETLIHRVDAELAHGEASDVDEIIADDGIDEAVSVFIGDVPDWATLNRGDNIIELRSPQNSWALRTGSYSGTTRSGRVLTDIPTALFESTTDSVDCTIRGTAAALNLWLWGRGDMDHLEIEGDPELANFLRDATAKSM